MTVLRGQKILKERKEKFVCRTSIYKFKSDKKD